MLQVRASICRFFISPVLQIGSQHYKKELQSVRFGSIGHGSVVWKNFDKLEWTHSTNRAQNRPPWSSKLALYTELDMNETLDMCSQSDLHPNGNLMKQVSMI